MSPKTAEVLVINLTVYLLRSTNGMRQEKAKGAKEKAEGEKEATKGKEEEEKGESVREKRGYWGFRLVQRRGPTAD